MDNSQIELAEKYVRYTDTSVFLTGKAGTGKTTFLRNIVATCNKRFVVVAPTGVAAINAGGVTIHSFFQLPPSAYLPTVKDFYNEYSLPQNAHNLRRNKIRLLQSLDLLIIDEISMVRADLLDAIDDRLRQYRHNNKPFGGVQLLMVGDLYQLPPVVKDDEWQYMKQAYASPFFFESKAFKQLNYISIELTHVYRQSESEFVEILNSIRNSQPNDNVLERLNSRYKPDFEPDNSEGYIRLTTHNAQADRINEAKLQQLEGKNFTFEAEIGGTFPDYMYPTEESLTLKKGAQVMFVRNDPDIEKKYFNGKIVTISDIDDNHIKVTDGDTTFEVLPLVWENTKYILNEESNEIEAVVEGTFKQMPLRLAWAITIHKSQGLTFDRAIIDAGRAFAFGQTYVALSRCRTLDGLVLKTPITAANLFTDKDVNTFTQAIPDAEHVRQRYSTDQINFFFGKLHELFEFGDLQKSLEQMQRLFRVELAAAYSAKADSFEKRVAQPFYDDIFAVAEKFHRQIAQLQAQCGNDTSNTHLHDRINKAVAYFSEKIDAIKAESSDFLSLTIKNKETLKRYNDVSDKFRQAIGLKKALLDNAKSGFTVEGYTNTMTNFILTGTDLKEEKKPATVKLNKNSTEFFDILNDWRSEKSFELEGRPVHAILTQNQMVEIARTLPRTFADLSAIEGLFGIKADEFGDEILELVNAFCESRNIRKKLAKGETYDLTLQMLNNGKTPEEIATERRLALSTIQSHISRLIKNGQLDAKDFISDSDFATLSGYLASNPDQPSSEVIAHFGGKYDYFTLNIAKAIMKLKTDS